MWQAPIYQPSEKYLLIKSWNNDKIMLGQLKNSKIVIEIHKSEECKWRRN